MDAVDFTAVVYYAVHFGNGTTKESQQKMVLKDGKWKMDIGSKQLISYHNDKMKVRLVNLG